MITGLIYIYIRSITNQIKIFLRFKNVEISEKNFLQKSFH